MRAMQSVSSVTANPFRQLPAEVVDLIIHHFGSVSFAGRYALANFLRTDRSLFQAGERHLSGLSWVAMVDKLVYGFDARTASEQLHAVIAGLTRISEPEQACYRERGIDSLRREFDLLPDEVQAQCFQFICSTLPDLPLEKRIVAVGELKVRIEQSPPDKFSKPHLEAAWAKLPEHGQTAASKFLKISSLANLDPYTSNDSRITKLFSEFDSKFVEAEFVRYVLAKTAIRTLGEACISSAVADAVLKLAACVPNHKYWLLVDYAHVLDGAACTPSAVFSINGFYAVAHKLLQQHERLDDDQQSQLLDIILSSLRSLNRSSKKLFLELVDRCLSIPNINAEDHCASLICALVEWGHIDALLKLPTVGIEWFHGLLLRFVKDSSFDRSPSEVIVEARAHIEGLLSAVASNEHLTEAFAKLWKALWAALCDRLSSSNTSNKRADVPWEAIEFLMAALMSTRPDSIDIEDFLQEAGKRLWPSHHAPFLCSTGTLLLFYTRDNFALYENYCKQQPEKLQCQIWASLVNSALSAKLKDASVGEASTYTAMVMMWVWKSSCFQGPSKLRLLRNLVDCSRELFNPLPVCEQIFFSSPDLTSGQKAWLLYFMIDVIQPSVWDVHEYGPAFRALACGFLMRQVAEIEEGGQSPTRAKYSKQALFSKIRRTVNQWPAQYRFFKADIKREMDKLAKADQAKPEGCALQ